MAPLQWGDLVPRADVLPVRVVDPETDRALTKIRESLKGLGNVVHTDKVLQVQIAKAGDDVVVQHQLASVPTHVSLGAPSSNARVWQSKPATNATITLQADAPTSLTVLVS